MAVTEVTHNDCVAARALRDDVIAGLLEPMTDVVRTLQRLAIAQVSPESPQLDSELLVRARSLAHSLQQIIDELITSGTHRGVLDGREPQETITVRSAIETAAAAASHALCTRHVVVRGAHRVAITTSTPRFHALLVRLFEVSIGSGEYRIVLDRSRGELLMQFEKCDISPDDLDSVRGLARTIGGTADRANANGNPMVVVWLPQQRVSDPIEQ